MSSLQNRTLLLGAFFGLTAIAIGAMGAHFLAKSLTPEQLTHIETGARYQMYHAITLLAVGVLAGKMKRGLALATVWLLTLGIVFFSFSLYGITIAEAFETKLPKLVYLITPLGGMTLMAGWITIGIAAFRNLYLRNTEKQQKNRR